MKHIFIITVFLLMSWQGTAQQKYFYAALDITKPISNTSWTDAVSARGMRLGYRRFITDKISAGVDAGGNVYSEYKPRQTFQTETGAITTDYFNYIYSYSLAVSGQYNFLKDVSERFIPYAGLGLGASNQEYVKYYNFYQEADKAWGFLARPEIGALIKFGERRAVALMAAIHYNYSTNRIKNFNYTGFSALGFQIGLALIND